MRGLVVLAAGLLGCGHAAQPRPIVEPCRAAAEGRRLYAAGRLEQAEHVLGDPARCPSPPGDVAALIAAIHAELARTGDPDTLLAEGLAARARGDEAGATRWLDRARVSAELSGAHAAITPWLPTRVGRQAMWSPNGRHVVWPGVDDSTDSWRVPHGMTILDVSTLRTVRVDGAFDPSFSPDGRFLVLHDDLGLGFFVIDPATAAVVAARRQSTLFGTYFAPDGRLLWTERVDDQHRVHLLAIGGGSELVLTAPTPPDPSDHPMEIDQVVVAPGGFVVAWTANGRPAATGVRGELLAWRDGQLIATIRDIVVAPAPQLDGTRVVFAVPAASGHERALAFIELGDPGRVVRMSARGACGTGRIAMNDGPARCSEGVFATRSGGHVCVWDLRSRKPPRSFRISAEEQAGDLYCQDDDVIVGTPGAPGYDTWTYSVKSGKQIGHTIGEDEDYVEGRIARLASGAVVARPDGVVIVPAQGPERILEASVDVTQVFSSPDESLIAGGSASGRASLWKADTGQLVWRSPPPPEARAAVFDPASGELVVASSTGALWRLDRASSRLRATPPIEGCALGMLASGLAGHALFVCGDQHEPMLYREGNAQPVMTFTQQSRARAYADAAPHYAVVGGSVAFDEGATIRVIPELDAKRAWTVPVTTNVLNVGITAAGDRLALNLDAPRSVVVHGSDARVRWQHPLEISHRPLLVGPGDQVVVRDASCKFQRWSARADKLDEVESFGCAAALDARGERLAVATEHGIAIRDLERKTTRSLDAGVTFSSQSFRSLAWSADGRSIAAVVDRIVYVWEVSRSAPPARIYVGDGAAVEVGPRGVRLYGPPADARRLLACRVGARVFPYALCQGRFEDLEDAPAGAR